MNGDNKIENTSNTTTVDESLQLEDIPSKPIPPETDECCGSGCIRCVYDIYEISLDRYNTLVSKINERNNEKLERIKQLNSNSNTSSISNNTKLPLQQNNHDGGGELIIEFKNEMDREDEGIISSIKEKNYLLNGLFDGDVNIGKIESYQVLSGTESPNRIYHLDIRSDKEISYIPGDYVSILAPNETDTVNRLLKRLKLGTGLKKVKIHTPPTSSFNHLPNKDYYCTILDLFTWVLNISFIPPQYILRILSEYCSNNDERDKFIYLSSNQGTQLYNETILEHQINFVSLLCKFKSCNITLKELLINIPPHETRKYSISSSPLRSGSFNIHITFNLVVKKVTSSCSSTITKDKFGLCTHWMKNQIELFKQLTDQHPHANSSNTTIPSIYLPFSIQKSVNQFNLPDKLSTPIILIATGTGLAPFRSFIHHRYYQIQDNQKNENPETVGKCLLFFGCKRNDWDNLYNNELLEFEKDGIISNLFISFSQHSNKTSNNSGYINNLILQNGELIYNLITIQQAFIFVCGNKNKIGISINHTLIEIILQHNKYNIKQESEAQSLLNSWIETGKYKRDVWN